LFSTFSVVEKLMRFRYLVLFLALSLVGCVSLPTGPGIMALPGSHRSLQQFRADDYRCRDYALAQIGGVSPNRAAAVSGVGSAVVGSALGAAAGAAVGGGSGAAVGAGVGGAVGGVAGVGAAAESGMATQDRYDIHYIQCMYALGHKVPVYGNFTQSQQSPQSAPSAPPPPPPFGPPPSPPLR
jgi:hypothetical protein